MQKTDIINSNEIATDISSLSAKDKEWFSKVYFREVIKSKHYDVQSQDELETHVNYVDSPELTANARYILDWLAGLQEREPKQHSKLPRITFQQALGHSKKWHAELAKQAEKSDRYIEPNDVNAPKVLDLSDGWEVFWLKTKIAKEAEGDAMGHCVGNGGYDGLNEGEAIFSIRKNNVAHITLHMEKLRIKQAVTKGNGDVPERYQYLVDESAAKIGVRLYLGRKADDTSHIDDGWHEISNRDKLHIQNGMLNSAKNEAAIICTDGTQEWWVDGKRHREDGPAVIRADGRQEWWLNGRRHREDGPAIIEASGTQKWYQNGNIHREDAPAIIREDGSQEWYINGKLHRKGGPAVIEADGSQMWWVDDKSHREDGPAVIEADGTQEWWIYSKRHRIDEPAVIRADNTQEWWVDGRRHRENGPAVICPDSGQEWWVNGERHREDGPAIIEADGTQIWYCNSEVHRDDGPAIIKASGTQEWFKHDNRHRDDGPAIIDADGSQEWFKNGKRHRKDGPAVIYPYGFQEWYRNGKRHRLDGPAINYASGRKEWWIEDEQCTEDQFHNAMMHNMLLK